MTWQVKYTYFHGITQYALKIFQYTRTFDYFIPSSFNHDGLTKSHTHVHMRMCDFVRPSL